MCGIVGYIGSRQCRELLLAGLEKLEYRGYDSAGVSILSDDRIHSVRAVGNLANLRAAVALPQNAPEQTGGAVATAEADGSIGIGHTRWATHGRVTEANAHPHFDTADRVHIVLNGIVENHVALRDRLAAAGADFTSETDAEVVAHLISHHYDGDLDRRRPRRLRGAPRPLRVRRDDRRRARRHRRRAQGVPAGHRRRRRRAVHRLRDPRLPRRDAQHPADRGRRDRRPARRRRRLHDVRRPADRARDRPRSTGTRTTAEKGGYETFTLKEIYEQPEAIAETVADRLPGNGVIDLGDIGVTDDELRDARRIIVVACGTSYHAGLVGRYAIEEWARVPVEMDIASEYRYRNPVLERGRHRRSASPSPARRLDTLAAMRLARERGAKVIARHERDGLAGHARLRRRPVHARRARDRRRGDEDVRRPGRGDVPARAAARAAARHAAGRPDRRARRRAALAAAQGVRAARDGRREGHRDRRALVRRGLLPLPRPPRRAADLPRGRAQAQGDLLHPDRRLRGRRDEARPDRAARREDAGRDASRPTRPCSTRSSRTSPRCAPAAPT